MISNLGRVKGIDRRVHVGHGAMRSVKGQIRKPHIGSGGYMKVTLRPGSKTIIIHSAVLRAFIGERPKGCQSCHNDGNRQNNSLCNLRWDTPSNNSNDKFAHGTVKMGESHYKTKLKNEDVLAIRISTQPHSKIAKQYGISRSNVGMIKSRLTWKHIT